MKRMKTNYNVIKMMRTYFVDEKYEIVVERVFDARSKLAYPPT